MERLTSESDLSSFSCSNEDLDDFLHNDAKNYTSQLLGVTYLFRENESNRIVCFFTLANASLTLEDLSRSKKKKVDGSIPHPKRRMSYPSVLLGRLGTSSDFQGKGIGQETLDFIKTWFRFENKTGCRFIVVDAYNDEQVLRFYEKCGFQFLQSGEDELQQLIEERGEDAELSTRHMYFDLSRIPDTPEEDE